MGSGIYQVGFKNGGNDALSGRKADYSWRTWDDEPEIAKRYKKGYRAGWKATIRQFRLARMPETGPEIGNGC